MKTVEKVTEAVKWVALPITLPIVLGIISLYAIISEVELLPLSFKYWVKSKIAMAD